MAADQAMKAKARRSVVYIYIIIEDQWTPREPPQNTDSWKQHGKKRERWLVVLGVSSLSLDRFLGLILTPSLVRMVTLVECSAEAKSWLKLLSPCAQDLALLKRGFSDSVALTSSVGLGVRASEAGTEDVCTVWTGAFFGLSGGGVGVEHRTTGTVLGRGL